VLDAGAAGRARGWSFRIDTDARATELAKRHVTCVRAAAASTIDGAGRTFGRGRLRRDRGRRRRSPSDEGCRWGAKGSRDHCRPR
jgi:hypothetical protein